MKKTILLISILFVLLGCASKKYTKQATRFDEAGLYEDAASYYYMAIKKKDSNVEAKLGLRKTGQLALDQKLEEVKKAYKRKDYKDAVYYYMEAESYYNKIKSVGVNLTIPEIYESYFEESKTDYIGKIYADGLNKLNREEFEAAQKIFIEIKGIDPDYKDVNEKYIIATYEPMYRQANEYMDNEQYRRAYYTYLAIIGGTGSYKQSISLMDNALEKGTLTILVPDFSFEQNNARRVAEQFTSKVKAELSHTSNPFIKIIDPNLVDEAIYRNGEIDVEAAKLAGINAILNGKVIKLSERAGALQKTDRKGYIKEVTRTKNKEGVEVEDIDYKKTSYTEYRVQNSVQLSVGYQMVSTENSEILVSDQLTQSNDDDVRYAIFDGDPNKLVPGYWKYRLTRSDEDRIQDNPNDIRSLQRLLKADRKIKPVSVLQEELLVGIVKNLSKKVERYDPEE